MMKERTVQAIRVFNQLAQRLSHQVWNRVFDSLRLGARGGRDRRNSAGQQF